MGGVVCTVQADSEDEVLAALQRLCAALGAEPLGRVVQMPGRPRWMGRAQLVSVRMECEPA